MSVLILYTRSFHPRADFRTGGVFFHGDNRGFSANPRATARIHHWIPINLSTAQFGKPVCRSDPSSNPPLTKATGMNFSNDYSAPDTKPRHSEEPKNITSYRPDGNQNVNIRIKYAGKNFAFPMKEVGAHAETAGDIVEKHGFPRGFLNKDMPHQVLGGEVSDGSNYTGPTSLVPYEVQSPVSVSKDNGIEFKSPVKRSNKRWSGMVPDLDVLNTVSLRINRDTKKVDVSCVITGDGFPNCESFIIDGANKVLFLASHVRTGTAITQLPGNRQIPMNNTSLESDWETNDSFGAQVSVRVALDFTGSGASHDLGSGAKSRDQWNTVNTGRSPYGAYSQRVRDHMWLPQSEWVDDRINNNPEAVDVVRKGKDAVGGWMDDAWEWWSGED